MNNTNMKKLELDKIVGDRALEASKMGITITDPNRAGNPIVYVNTAFLRISGYEQDEVIGRNCRFLQGVDTDLATIETISVGLKQQCEFSVLLKNYRKNGTAFWNELHLSPIKDANGTLLYFIGFQNDVTARVLTEESLRYARSRQNDLIEASGDFFWEIDRSGLFSFVSQKIFKTTGYLPNDFNGHTIFDFLAPDDLQEQRASVEELLVNRQPFQNLKLNLKTKSGATAWVRLNGTPRFSPTTHEFIGLIGSGGDITEEHGQLMDTYRLSALGQVAAEIAHEIANPLAVIDGSASFLEQAISEQNQESDQEDQDGERGREPERVRRPEWARNQTKILNAIAKIRKMVARTQRIISGAKAMAKNGAADLNEVVLLKDLIDESVELCVGKLKLINAKVEVLVTPADLIIECKQIQISQVIINLVSNACDALRDDSQDLNERWVRIEAKLIAGGDIELRISNAGENKFETINRSLKVPFQSGKSGKSGTGVGLQLVKKVLRAHSARIEADAASPHTSLVIIIPQKNFPIALGKSHSG
jgi:PAS domain S-box-containing protein